MKTKIRKIGNSLGIILPAEVHKEAGLQLGDAVLMELKGENIVISPKNKPQHGGVDPQFAKVVEQFMSEHEDVLKELAKR